VAGRRRLADLRRRAARRRSVGPSILLGIVRRSDPARAPRLRGRGPHGPGPACVLGSGCLRRRLGDRARARVRSGRSGSRPALRGGRQDRVRVRGPLADLRRGLGSIDRGRRRERASPARLARSGRIRPRVRRIARTRAASRARRGRRVLLGAHGRRDRDRPSARRRSPRARIGAGRIQRRAARCARTSGGHVARRCIAVDGPATRRARSRRARARGPADRGRVSRRPRPSRWALDREPRVRPPLGFDGRDPPRPRRIRPLGRRRSRSKGTRPPDQAANSFASFGRLLRRAGSSGAFAVRSRPATKAWVESARSERP
jgi:hypothetical protein